MFAGDPGPLVWQRSEKKVSMSRRQLYSASRSSPSLEVLQVARIRQGGTVNFLSCRDSGAENAEHWVNKPFSYPVVFKWTLRLDMNLPFDKPKPKPKPHAQDLWDRVGSLRDLVNCYSLDRFESASTEVALQDVARERTEEDRFLAGEGVLGFLLNYFDHAGKSKYCI